MHCEYDPTDRQNLYYPACASLFLIHKEYRKAMAEKSYPHYEYVAFCKVVKRNFPHVKKASYESMFHCDECLQLAEKLRAVRQTRDIDQINSLEKQIDLHRAIVSLERQVYKTHQLMSRQAPDLYLTLIIDGMDQNKCVLPNYGQLRGDKLEKMFLHGPRAHLTGVRDHNGQVWCYWTYDQIPKDGALVVNCLLLTLLDIFKARGSLPEVLFLQLDNTKKENKNWMVMGLLSKLLKTVFGKPIQVNFLPVGHTHEDIDQFFSKVSVKARDARPRSLPHMMAAVDTILTNGLKPRQMFLDTYLDLRHFISGELPDGKDRLKGLDGAHDIRLSFSPQYPGVAQYGPTTPWPIIQTKFMGQFQNVEDRNIAYAPTAGARLCKEGARMYNPCLPEEGKVAAITGFMRLGQLRPPYCSSSSMLTEGSEDGSSGASLENFRKQLQEFRDWFEVGKPLAQ